MMSFLKNAWSSLTQKTKDDCPLPIALPDGLDSKILMRSFELGHGFKWLALQEPPVLVAYGMSNSIVPNMLLTHRTVWIQRDDSSHVERLEHVFDLLK